MFSSFPLIPVGLGYIFLPFLFLPRYVYPLLNKKNPRTAKIMKFMPLLVPLVVYVVSLVVANYWMSLSTWSMSDAGLTFSGEMMQRWLSIAFGGLALSAVMFGVLGVVTIPFYIFILTEKLWKKKIDLFHQIAAGIGVISIVVTAILIVIGAIGFGSEVESPAASRFFRLHAAIKNTCVIDPKRENCPNTLEEISYIEPQEYAYVARNTQMIYQYYPETGDYTFIVRYSPHRAVIFDPRYKKISSSGFDFAEHKVMTAGQDRLESTPPFPGPWDQIKEWNK